MRTATSESAARRAARRAGFVAIKSRRRTGTYENQGGFMVIDPFTRFPVAGFQYDLTPKEVVDFCR